MLAVRVAAGALIALVLAGCAGGSFGDSAPAAAQTPTTDMAGRWMLSAPDAPACGMNFTGAAGAREGSVSPEGGCPGNFFLSRRWTTADGALIINDAENQPLAQLNFVGGRFAGQSTAGTPVTLAR